MIPYGHQSINEEDISAVDRVLRSNFLTTGPEVEIFESALSKHMGNVEVVSVSSGTAALHVAYKAAGIGPGDEVITPPLTFIATQATAALLGANIVFSDIQPETGNLDPSKLISLITNRTKAIVAVDYAGHPADLDEISKICKEHGLVFIEDAAHSFGSSYRERKVGSIADITTFSFFPTKNIATGEGGAVASLDSNLMQKARLFARQGLIRDESQFIYPNEGPWHQEVHNFGLNYRMPDILAALGTSQLERLGGFKARRKEIFEMYSCLLAEHAESITIPTKRSYVDPMWHLYPIRVQTDKRRWIFTRLRQVGIGVQVNYFPSHLQPVFRDRVRKNSLPEAENFYSGQISLPMHVDLTNEQIHYICNQVAKAIIECA